MTQECFNKIYAELFSSYKASCVSGDRREQASNLRAMSRLEKMNPQFVNGAQDFIATAA